MTRIIEVDTPRLRLRQWRDRDREPFAALNADPVVMEFFPSVHDRAASDASIDLWRSQFSTQGWSNWAVELRSTGELIGFTGLTVPRRVLPCSPCVEIGWRLAAEFWNRGYATEGAREALRFGWALQAPRLEEVVSFTVPANVRSRRVMEKLGMSHDPADDFEHPRLPPGHPLRRHVLYRARRDPEPGSLHG